MQFDITFQPAIDERQVKELVCLASVTVITKTLRRLGSSLCVGTDSPGSLHCAASLCISPEKLAYGKPSSVRAYGPMEDLRKPFGQFPAWTAACGCN